MFCWWIIGVYLCRLCRCKFPGHKRRNACVRDESHEHILPRLCRLTHAAHSNGRSRHFRPTSEGSNNGSLYSLYHDAVFDRPIDLRGYVMRQSATEVVRVCYNQYCANRSNYKLTSSIKAKRFVLLSGASQYYVRRYRPVAWSVDL